MNELEPHPNPESLVLQPRRLPVFSTAIIIVSAAMFLLELRRGSLTQDRWLLYGPAVSAGQWWRLLTYAVEHGGALHLLLNMSVVYTLGFGLERTLGTARFAVISVVTCLGAAAFALFFRFKTPMVGASGVILGWAGAMLPIATRAGRRSLGIWLAQIAVISFIPGISWEGHLGGFLFGLPCGFALRAGPRVFASLSPLFLVVAAIIAAYAGHAFRS